MDEFNAAFWKETAGQKLGHLVRLDELLRPYTMALLERAALEPGLRVVDVGCGTSSIVREAAEICGPNQVTGVDISAPMLEVASRMATDAGHDIEFVHADATVWTPGEGTVDRILSRFGIMFFNDRAAAFRNLRSWLAPNGALIALCWQKPEANPWVGEAFQVLAKHLEMPRPAPGRPGPFSLADPDQLRALLETAGFDDVRLDALPVTARIEGDKAAALDFYQTWCPTARFFAAASESARIEISADFEALVERTHDGHGIDLVGGAWAIRAR